jgi:osmoprotectant transport system permease protein
MKRTLLLGAMTVLVASLEALSQARAQESAAPAPEVRVGSKEFTESVILGEIVTHVLEAHGQRATHLAQLGGTRLVYDALRRGEIDVYPEYTGTLEQEIFAGRHASSLDDLRELLRNDGIVMGEPLGFSNNYALAVTRETAGRLGLNTISDLAGHLDLRLGLSNEFLDRDDGWKNLRKSYGLAHQEVRGIHHDIAYRDLEAGTIDVMDVYTTDARIAELALVLLEDDRMYFPNYQAVLLSRADLAERSAEAARLIVELGGAIGQEDIMALNAMAGPGKSSESQAAATFVRDKLSLAVEVEDESTALRIWRRTLEHLDLVWRSLIPAIIVAVPLGVAAAKWPRWGRMIIGAAGVVQTIPALALLVLLIAPVAYLGLNTLGAGSATAVIALFLYSLLPIVQNTATGVATIPPEYRESATALGLSPAFRLLHIELPLASPAILAGVKTAAVLNVGFATLGALVGARGYGQPILTGIRLNDTGLILQGAVPAACLAILLQLAFEAGERWFLPAGLRPVAERGGDQSA